MDTWMIHTKIKIQNTHYNQLKGNHKHYFLLFFLSLWDFLDLDFLDFFLCFLFLSLSESLLDVDDVDDDDEELLVDEVLDDLDLFRFLLFFFCLAFCSFSCSFCLSSASRSLCSGVAYSSSLSLLVLLTSNTISLFGSTFIKFLHWNVRCPA